MFGAPCSRRRHPSSGRIRCGPERQADRAQIAKRLSPADFQLWQKVDAAQNEFKLAAAEADRIMHEELNTCKWQPRNPNVSDMKKKGWDESCQAERMVELQEIAKLEPFVKREQQMGDLHMRLYRVLNEAVAEHPLHEDMPDWVPLASFSKRALDRRKRGQSKWPNEVWYADIMHFRGYIRSGRGEGRL